MKIISLALIATVNCNLWRTMFAYGNGHNRRVATMNYFRCKNEFLPRNHRICQQISFLLE